MKVDLIQSIGRVSRINLNKIFSSMESHSRSSSTCSSTTHQEASSNKIHSNKTTTSTTSTKRNLFGKLNHDLLKQDLNQMWKETRDRQRVKWSFDFENLCPLSQQKEQEEKLNTKYEWSNINDETSLPDFYKCNTSHSAYNARKLNRQPPKHLTSSSNNHSGTSASYPLASANLFNSNLLGTSPTHNNNKTLSSKRSLTDESEEISSSSDVELVKFESIFKLSRANTCTLIKPTPKRRYTKKSSPDKTQLIITTSENRKDTLRSATKQSKTTSTLTSTNVIKTTDTQHIEYKQQSLLYMLKQRKQRRGFVNETSKNDSFSHHNHNQTQQQSTQIVQQDA